MAATPIADNSISGPIGRPIDRIDTAIARIEAACARRAAAGDALAARHAALRQRMAEAVAALDDVLARGTPD